MRNLMMSAAILAAAAAVPARAEADVASLYEVSTEGTTTKMRAGDTGKVVIAIKTKNGAHVSDEAPLKIELSSTQVKLTKQKLTMADTLSPKKSGDGDWPDPRFEVSFVPAAAAPATIEAKMTFFICTDKQCSRQTKQLSWAVEVK